MLKFKSLYHILKCRDSYYYLQDLYLINRSLEYFVHSDVSESIQNQLSFIVICIDKEMRRIQQHHRRKIKKELFDENNS